jgi:LysM repeat protein
VVQHTVKKGETIWWLAVKRYKVSPEMVAMFNPGVNLDALQPGDMVLFPTRQ